MISIRAEQPDDRDAVRRVNEAAFGQPGEADLVDRLRGRTDGYLGLVAVQGGEVVGHAAFTPMTMAPPAAVAAYGLAPMAVLPLHQRAGVGAALVQAGLAACRQAGGGAVFVLGHPAYYPRFGFVPASRFGIRSEYDAPDEAFMALELMPGALDGVHGVAKYAPAFAA